VPAPVLPLACLFAVFLILISGCSGTLTSHGCRGGLLLLRGAGLLRLAIRPVVAIGPPGMVWVLLRLFCGCLLCHRYQLSYRSGIQKYLIILGAVFVRGPVRFFILPYKACLPGSL